MKLSEIARYRELIDRLTPQDGELYIKESLEPITQAIAESSLSTDQDRIQIIDRINDVQRSMSDFSHAVAEIKQKIITTIEQIEPTYLKNSYDLYDNNMRNDSVDLILNRRIMLDQANQAYVESRIQKYSQWRFPGLIIRPGLESLINYMVALDPLYVFDTTYDLLENAKQNFNPLYRDRVRWCTGAEELNSHMLDQVPDDQIGFALVYNFFHYKPFEIIRAYLTEIRSKLRPGGTLVFTFNDSDRWGGVELAERYYMCYTPGRLVKSLLENLGLEITDFRVFDNATSWIEVRRPGELSSLRGGQTLAKVIAKSK